MKIVLIGPVYPYRGGIAHYTGLLCRALRTRHEVVMVSYKMQYPKFLYKKEQKDYANRSFQVEDAKYWINTANPINILAAAHRIKKLTPDAVIFQWWHPYFTPCYYLLCKFLGKIPIIFTCHNVFPHERFRMDRFLCRLVLKLGSGYIVQSRLDELDLMTIKKDANHVVTPHPIYSAFKMQDMGRQQARELLSVGKESPMLLFFGFVREYKGLQYLIDALPKIKEQIEDVRLWIVGDFGDNKARYEKQIADNGVGEIITVVEGYIPDCEVEKYFAASDLVVLPYISATQSGIVQIAYGFEKPVVVTDVGGLPEVVRDKETGYIIPSRNSDAIADSVIHFFKDGSSIDWQGNIKKRVAEFSWDVMVERIESLLGK